MTIEATFTLVAFAGFLVGFLVGGCIGVSGTDKRKIEVEKRGVWTFKDRAYKLTLITKDPR